MDVLKKELEEAFSKQQFSSNSPNKEVLKECREQIRTLTAVRNGCAVLSDLADNRSYLSIGTFGDFLGFSPEEVSQEVIESLDEDYIYGRIHPEDLVEKRILELKFFEFLCRQPIADRLKYCSNCRIRMIDEKGVYRYITNQTQILRNSPCGNMWLALCQYELSSDQSESADISSRITNLSSGEVMPIQLHEERKSILSERERNILLLIKEGLLSKEIAIRLNISIHTVNRHRQNIIQKLSVGNSQEAIRTAEMMKLL